MDEDEGQARHLRTQAEKPFAPRLFGDKPDDGEPPEYDVAKGRDQAKATFRVMFIEVPRKHWPMLSEAFAEARAEAQG
jgi:hypothetical protein